LQPMVSEVELERRAARMQRGCSAPSGDRQGVRPGDRQEERLRVGRRSPRAQTASRGTRRPVASQAGGGLSPAIPLPNPEEQALKYLFRPPWTPFDSRLNREISERAASRARYQRRRSDPSPAAHSWSSSASSSYFPAVSALMTGCRLSNVWQGCRVRFAARAHPPALQPWAGLRHHRVWRRTDRPPAGD